MVTPALLIALVLLNFLTLSSISAEEITTETLWRVDTNHAIYSKPTLDGDFIYIGGEDGVLRAIDSESGKVRWTYKTQAGIASGAGRDEARVYVISRDGVVHGVDKFNGKGIWTFRTEGEKQWDYWDIFLSTPVADDKHSLFFGSGDHHVYSINKRTGAIRWKVETGAIVHGSPVLSGEKVIIGSFDGKMYGIDQANGNVLWTFKTVGNSYFRNGEIPGSPTVNGDLVYFGSRDYNLYAILEETGTGAWNERTPSWVVAKPLVVDGKVFVGISDSPQVFAFGAKDGQRKWSTKVGLNVFGGAELIGTKHIAIPGLDGRINFIERETGKIEGFLDTNEAQRSRSIFFDANGKHTPGQIRSWEDIFSLYDRYFEELGGIAGGLAVGGDVIYFSTGAGSIAAVRVTGIGEDEDAEKD